MDNLERRCIATSKTTGKRCGRAPIVGGYVCAFHGGASPLAKKAAQQRLLEIVEPVLGVFAEIVAVYRSVRCPTCGNPSGDPMPVIRLGQIVLDRTGFGPHATLKVEKESVAPSFARWLTRAEMRMVSRCMEAARARMAAGAPMYSDVTDGEVVRDEKPTGSIDTTSEHEG